jgi:hypothetical protein
LLSLAVRRPVGFRMHLPTAANCKLLFPNHHQQPTRSSCCMLLSGQSLGAEKLPSALKQANPRQPFEPVGRAALIPARILWGTPHLARDPPQPNPQEAPSTGTLPG